MDTLPRTFEMLFLYFAHHSFDQKKMNNSVEKSLVSYLQSTLDQPFDLSNIEIINNNNNNNNTNQSFNNNNINQQQKQRYIDEDDDEDEIYNQTIDSAISPTSQFESSYINTNINNNTIHSQSSLITNNNNNNNIVNEEIQNEKNVDGDSEGQIEQKSYKEIFSKIPQLSSFGKPIKSSKPIALTESDSDYVVTCIQHFFNEYIVFQFNCTNCVQSHQLNQITIDLDFHDVNGLEEDYKIQAMKLDFFAESDQKEANNKMK